jgi:hypothetical protein
MKKIYLVIALAFAASPALAAAEDDRPVSFDKLPDAAQRLIRDHFPDSQLTLATIDREFMDTSYDVIFTDGTKIEFNSRGEWVEIETRRGLVPEGVLMPGIVNYVKENFPGAGVRDIERDRHGFEVNLDNRRELYFDSRGNFRGYDD